MIIDHFVHPYTKEVLRADKEGNLINDDGAGILFKNCDGSFDFSVSNAEIGRTRDAYNDHYARGNNKKMTLSDVSEPWSDPTVPWRKTMLHYLGSLDGRKILLLGNGASYREFFFLTKGAKIIFTDLSIVAAIRAREAFVNSELKSLYGNDIEFHAVDAMHLPFPDESFDIIYGSKFVGFLNNLQDFFSEVKRCLKPGGICRFEDDAHSPTWDALRKVSVVPIKACVWEKMSSLSQVRSGTARRHFGFKEEQLVPFCARPGFARMLFVREHFFLRAAQLAWGKIVNWKPEYLAYAKPVYMIMKWIDDRLARTTWMHKNSLALTMGFDK